MPLYPKSHYYYYIARLNFALGMGILSLFANCRYIRSRHQRSWLYIDRGEEEKWKRNFKTQVIRSIMWTWRPYHSRNTFFSRQESTFIPRNNVPFPSQTILHLAVHPRTPQPSVANDSKYSTPSPNGNLQCLTMLNNWYSAQKSKRMPCIGSHDRYCAKGLFWAEPQFIWKRHPTKEYFGIITA